MLAASLVPVLGHTTTIMGISQQDDNFDLPSGTNGVYLALSVSSTTSPNRSASNGDVFPERNQSSSPSLASSPESSPVLFSKEGHEDLDREEQEEPEGEVAEAQKPVESHKPCVRPKYGSIIVGLPDKFMKKVEGLEKKKEKQKKKKWRAVSAEDMGFKLTLFPRTPIICDEKTVENELKIFDAMIETELDDVNDQVKPFRHLLQLEGIGLSKEDKFTRKDSHRRVQKAHKQVKSKEITSVLNNRGRKTLYIHFRLYKRHPFLHCSNLGHPNLPSPPKREGVCLDVAKSAIRAQVRAVIHNGWGSASQGHPPQNLAHTLDNRNGDSELPTDMLSFLINLQHREMTPLDYEMLLRLDESVIPKTVAEDVISAFVTDVVDESTAGDFCSVCMEMYEVGQTRKFLPCEHVFHEQCIDMWLANSSQNCPLDGLAVGLS
ncbi:hypothetical protein ACOMHN_007317 [Nucella lapillus]